jgi:hypothetical protein
VRAEQALGLPEGTLSPADEARRCLQARLDHDTQRIVDQQRALSGGLRTQPPWVSIALDDVTVAWWSDDRGLRETPVHVDAWRRALRSGDPPSPSHDLARPTAPRAATTSTAGTMRVVPPSRGLRIGGAGLAHEAVVILGNESDPALQWALPKLLALREAHLGQLAITVVARDTPEAALLATRLCAARRLDLAQPFLRALLAKVRRQASDEWERVSALVDAEIEAVRARASATASATSQADPLACAVLATEARTSRAMLFDGVVVGFDDLEHVEAALSAPSVDASLLWMPRVLEPI